jgi:hypothetical protein
VLHGTRSQIDFGIFTSARTDSRWAADENPHFIILVAAFAAAGGDGIAGLMVLHERTYIDQIATSRVAYDACIPANRTAAVTRKICRIVLRATGQGKKREQ